MAARTSIAVDGLSHLTAIPLATRIGPLVVSSVIAPFRPGSREHSPDAAGQIEQIFENAGRMLEAAGATWADVAKMSFWVAEAADRPALEPIWVRHFPDETSRPARHTHVAKGAPFVTGEFLAYISG